MAESFLEQYKRTCREMDAAVTEALAVSDDRALLAALERLARERQFPAFSWRWAPALASRDRVLFRPFCLSHISAFNVDAKGEWVRAWKSGAASAKALERWLADLDERDDVELTRRLYTWRLSELEWKKRQGAWSRDLVEAFRRERSPARRRSALAKRDVSDVSLDGDTAKQLYEIDPKAAGPFLLARVPRFFWSGERRSAFAPLLAATAKGDDQALHFGLYRKLIDEKPWQEDVRALLGSVPPPSSGGDLDAELTRRHPETALPNAAEVFLEIMKARPEEALAYLIRNVSAIASTRSWMFGRAKDPPALLELLALTEERGYLDLWGALVRTCTTRDRFDAVVARLAKSTRLSDEEAEDRLRRAAGHGREANFAGVSFAEVKHLDEKTACVVYERFPNLVRGPMRAHIAPGFQGGYPSVVKEALEADDEDLITFFGARLALLQVRWGETASINKSIDYLCDWLEALPEATFLERATGILSRIPAFSIYGYTDLLRQNRLARLLFERATVTYLGSGSGMRDLLEAPQIHVQVLAFRALASGDRRAGSIAAANVDLLQATLFRPLHRRTRLLALEAIEAAGTHDETTARYLTKRLREAMGLPSRRYPKEALVRTLGKLLAQWPRLRADDEAPRVFEGATP